MVKSSRRAELTKTSGSVDRIGVVGLGRIGGPVAARLHDRGFSVLGMDSDVLARRRAEGSGIPVVDDVRLMQPSTVVLLAVPGEAEVSDALFRNGLLESAQEMTTIVDMTTSHPASSVKTAEAVASKGHRYVDAPVTGGHEGAKTGQLVVMAGGEENVILELRPILNAVSRQVFHMGPIGSGHLTKLLHNVISHSVFLATCEGVAAGLANGLSMERLIAAFDAGNAQSYATSVRFPRYILNGDYNGGADLRTVAKDINIAHTLVGSEAEKLLILQATRRYWNDFLSAGPEGDDYTTAFLRLARSLGVDLHSSDVNDGG